MSEPLNALWHDLLLSQDNNFENQRQQFADFEKGPGLETNPHLLFMDGTDNLFNLIGHLITFHTDL